MFLEQRDHQQYALYALKRVAIDNKEEFPSAAKTIQNNFYMDNFINSVETPEEAIKFFKQLQLLLSKHGFEVKKRITNSDVVTNAMPETTPEEHLDKKWATLGQLSGT